MFNGFSQRTSDFIWELSFNNERPWFLEHKAEFETVLNEPFKALYADTKAALQLRCPKLPLEGHISRIYRDARRLFGRGPYKDHLWFTLFSGVTGKDGPCFWFEIGAAQYSFGFGAWMASPAVMSAYRAAIAANPARFTRIVEAIGAMPEFRLFGEEYKKPKGDMGPLLNPWYNRKVIGVECCRDFGGDLLSPDLPAILAEEYEKLLPLYDFVMEAWLSATEN